MAKMGRLEAQSERDSMWPDGRDANGRSRAGTENGDEERMIQEMSKLRDDLDRELEYLKMTIATLSNKVAIIDKATSIGSSLRSRGRLRGRLGKALSRLIRAVV